MTTESLPGPAFLLAHEPALRLAAFAGVLAIMCIAEALWPKRPRRLARLQRWPSNLAIVALDTLLLRLVAPVLAVAYAAMLQADGPPLLDLGALPTALGLPLAILALDLVIYGQHRLFHAIPFLWRLHRMHHADTDFDSTTALRFHPLEILLSMAIKLAAIAALGPAPEAVLLFELILSASALFNHGNLALPAGLDRVLRLVLVTPDMHRVHHSVRPQETNSNFGFCLPWWDRLFGTYRAAPEDGQDGMTIGLAEFRAPAEARLDRMLTQPFRDR